MTFNPKGRLSPWSCSMFTSEKARNIALVHYGDDWSVTSITVSYDGKETTVVSAYVSPIPDELRQGEARLLLSKEEREDSGHHMSKTWVADPEWTPAQGLLEEYPIGWGAAVMYLKHFADSELTRWTFEHMKWLKTLEEANAEA
jgi:hypothetical protein